MSRRERSLVPEADFASYYGRPILKAATWKADIPFYLFAGGLAGASAVLAEGAALQGLPALERAARLTAATAVTAGTGALVHDLGRPERFLNMLRVIRPTSPMSVGSYILAPFSGAAAVAAASELTGRVPRLGRLAGVGAAVLGPPLATYTAALIADTAVPAWHEAHRELPFVFAGSSGLAAGGVALVLAPRAQNAPARRMLVAGAALELVAGEVMERGLGIVAEPYREGPSGRLMTMAKATAATAALLSLGAGRSRTLAVVAGAAAATASAMTRFGIFEAGKASTQDPKYVVTPQRARRAESPKTAQDQPSQTR
ncbi:MAG: NrfD/PsrC family molybdoenzyme membrane anchor subunit [Marmoricola sp.]